MPTVRKFQLIFVFLLGSFAVGAALVRMVICIKQGTPSGPFPPQSLHSYALTTQQTA